MDIFIVGEDKVTIGILNKIVRYCSDFRIEPLNIRESYPARGGQIKKDMHIYNNLAAHYPVILLTDLDNELCAPSLKEKLCEGFIKTDRFLINIAVDEAEAWLMGDRDGFARYFCIPTESIPQPRLTKQNGRIERREMIFNCKSSFYLTNYIILECTNILLKKQLTPKKGASKGPEYNTAMIPFISDYWNIDIARENSNSLDRMINRIINLI